jgi:hypothetical protein
MKILHWIKSLGRVLAFLPVCLFLGVSVNAADLSFEVIAEGDGETAQERDAGISALSRTPDRWHHF